jgi:hypothetical protein
MAHFPQRARLAGQRDPHGCCEAVRVEAYRLVEKWLHHTEVMQPLASLAAWRPDHDSDAKGYSKVPKCTPKLNVEGKGKGIQRISVAGGREDQRRRQVPPHARRLPKPERATAEASKSLVFRPAEARSKGAIDQVACKCGAHLGDTLPHGPQPREDRVIHGDRQQ